MGGCVVCQKKGAFHDNDRVLMFFLDFVSKKAYLSSDDYLIKDLGRAEMTGNMEEKEINCLIKLLDDAEVQKWKEFYRGNNGNTMFS